MDDRTPTFFSVFLLAAAAASGGCGYNQQTRFQMSFLPPAPHPAAADADTLPPAPVVQPNLYLQQPPAFILASSQQLPPRKTTGDALVMRAEKTFQDGKRSYHSNDIPEARRQFDVAMDLMLEASDENPADRDDYRRRLEEMTEAIHRFDLAGMGAAVAVEQGKFEKAPLEDILEMTFPVDPKLKDRVREQVAATISQLPLSVNDKVLSYINYFSRRGQEHHHRRNAALGQVPSDDPAHSGRRRRAAGVDSPGAGRIRLHPARHVPQGCRRHVAVRPMARPVIRSEPDTATSTNEWIRKRPRVQAARHLRDLYQPVRRLVPGDRRL